MWCSLTAKFHLCLLRCRRHSIVVPVFCYVAVIGTRVWFVQSCPLCSDSGGLYSLYRYAPTNKRNNLTVIMMSVSEVIISNTKAEIKQLFNLCLLRLSRCRRHFIVESVFCYFVAIGTRTGFVQSCPLCSDSGGLYSLYRYAPTNKPHRLTVIMMSVSEVIISNTKPQN